MVKKPDSRHNFGQMTKLRKVFRVFTVKISVGPFLFLSQPRLIGRNARLQNNITMYVSIYFQN